MAGYTHRDRRAHRDVRRALWTTVAAIVALTGVGLEVPLPFAGLVAVVALGALGAVYLGWSEGMLSSYSNDLRRAREGRETDGFIRAEVGSTVGFERDVGRPTAVSPHARRRYPGTPEGDADPALPDRSDGDQA
jgi:hypothetical protein